MQDPAMQEPRREQTPGLTGIDERSILCAQADQRAEVQSLRTAAEEAIIHDQFD